MTRRGVISCFVAGIMAIVSGCGDERFPDLRYRLTVEVDTPTGLKTGSSVYEIKSRGYTAILGEGGLHRFSRSLRGEAVAVDIAPGQTLFALLRGEQSNTELLEELPFRVFKPEGLPEGDAAKFDDRHSDILLMTKQLLVMRDTRAVPRWTPTLNKVDPPRSDYPMLVQFANIDDPNSVERVDPDDLAKSFGLGVRLRRITVQITDAPVTTGIEKRLGWLTSYVNRHFDRSSTVTENMVTRSLSAHLNSGSFSTDIAKEP